MVGRKSRGRYASCKGARFPARNPGAECRNLFLLSRADIGQRRLRKKEYPILLRIVRIVAGDLY